MNRAASSPPAPRVPLALRIERRLARTVFLVCRLLVRPFPFGRVRVLGSVLGTLQFSLASGTRRRTVRELAAVLGREPRDPVVKACLLEAYRCNLTAVLEALKMFDRRQDLATLRARVAIEGLAEVQSALAEGRGAILLPSHAGNGALLVVELAAAGVPVSVVYREAHRLDPGFLEHGLRLYGAQGIRATDGLKAYGQMLSALRGNRLVVVMADQGTKKAKDGMPIRFLGKDMPMPAGPAQLARHAQVPVLPVATTAARPAWRFEIQPPIRFEPDSTLADDVHALFRVNEGLILRNPQWWSWPHRRWKDFPLGADVDAAGTPRPASTA